MEKMKNKIDLLWDELNIILDNDKDFRVIKVKNDIIVIEALDMYTFSKSYIYYKILSFIIPLECSLKMDSRVILPETAEKDTMIFDIEIFADKLYYKGTIKIIFKR